LSNYSADGGDHGTGGSTGRGESAGQAAKRGRDPAALPKSLI